MISLGPQVISWMEHHLCHGPGPVAGDEVELDDEFAWFIVRCYALTSHGRRVKRRVFLSRPKGRAKSELAGMLCCAEALAPVRFSHWAKKGETSFWGYEFDEGEPVGRPVRWPFLRCLATEETQSGNTYENVEVMLKHLSFNYGAEYPGIDVGKTRTLIEGGGEIRPSTASNAAKDGGKETFVVFDETWLYESPELRGMHRTVLDNLGKNALASEPWSLETSTMYRPGMRSVAEGTHKYAQQVASGDVIDDSLLFDHRQVPPEIDWDDDEALRNALVELYGPAAEWTDFDRIMAEIHDPQNDDANRRRKWGNQVVKATEQAFDVMLWANLFGEGKTIADKELVTLGFDGSRSRDTTALIATGVESGHQELIEVWVPRVVKDPDGERKQIDEEAVDSTMQQAFDRFDVWRLLADPWGWESWLSLWAGRWGKERVVAWDTRELKRMAYALRAYVTSMQTHELSHDGNSIMASHIANAHRRPTRMIDEDGNPLWLIDKEHPNSDRKIDAAMAGCLSWRGRLDAIAAGATRAQKRSKTLRFG